MFAGYYLSQYLSLTDFLTRAEADSSVYFTEEWDVMPNSNTANVIPLEAEDFSDVSSFFSTPTVNDFIEVEDGEAISIEDAYGIPADGYQVIHRNVIKHQSISDILLEFKIPYERIDLLAKKAESVYRVNRLRTGKPYVLLCNEQNTAEYMIYEDTPTDYVVFDLRNDMEVYTCQKNVATVVKEINGVVNSSLSQAVAAGGGSQVLVNQLAELFAWSVNFFRLKKGDHFKVVYESKQLNDKEVGLGDIHAAYFVNDNEKYYVFRFEQDGQVEYYDEEGRMNKQAFLKAPLKYSRISSRYSKKRYHPILKRYKGHFGTDYAAPTGTPVYSVADGKITKKGYGRGNGNYIKVKHNSVYATQYLHLSKFAKGMKVGKKVKQGEVIGYVGSTGLATGPHLCFRFWKNGKQVDPYKQKLPRAQEIEEALKPQYFAYMDSMKLVLEK